MARINLFFNYLVGFFFFYCSKFYQNAPRNAVLVKWRKPQEANICAAMTVWAVRRITIATRQVTAGIAHCQWRLWIISLRLNINLSFVLCFMCFFLFHSGYQTLGFVFTRPMLYHWATAPVPIFICSCPRERDSETVLHGSFSLDRITRITGVEGGNGLNYV